MWNEMLRQLIKFLITFVISINLILVHAQVKRRAEPPPTVTDSDTESDLMRRNQPPPTLYEERSGSPQHEIHKDPAEMSDNARPIDYDDQFFSPNPEYAEKEYDVDEEMNIYGGKTHFDAPRPVIEWGYPLYKEGPLGQSYQFLGKKNELRPQFLIYGDLRTAVAYNDNGANELGQAAVRLNLDLDLKLTATERFHAFLRPLDDNGEFTRVEFSGDGDDSELELDLEPETFFFEGDAAQIHSGLADKHAQYDLPFALGLMPLFFQNGVWVEDEFWGGAFSIPARNSPKLDISNFDVTFFTGLDKVNSGAFLDQNNNQDEHEARLYGVTTFMDVNQGYLEAGYGFLDDRDDSNGDFSYHNLTVAFTKRYFGKVSNSVRLIHNFGQSPGDGFEKSADGYAVLIENSLITHKPSTLIPYFNLFYGSKRPQSLARKDGILKNTGINFETDGLTGFPKLDDSANGTYGAAIGIQYLFNLDKQIIAEVAAVNTHDEQANRNIDGDQYAFGLRYQKPLNDRWIFRADAMHGWLDDADDVFGARIELRRKF